MNCPRCNAEIKRLDTFKCDECGYVIDLLPELRSNPSLTMDVMIEMRSEPILLKDATVEQLREEILNRYKEQYRIEMMDALVNAVERLTNKADPDEVWAEVWDKITKADRKRHG